MAGKQLLVPGTSGCRLLLDGQHIGWPAALTAQCWVAGKTGIACGLDGGPLAAAELEELLSMEFADPASPRRPA